jgi:hypothetical protein
MKQVFSWRVWAGLGFVLIACGSSKESGPGGATAGGSSGAGSGSRAGASSKAGSSGDGEAGRSDALAGDAGAAGEEHGAGGALPVGGSTGMGDGGDGGLAGSGGSSGGSGGSSGLSNNAGTAGGNVPSPELFVDPSLGHDDSVGSRSAPFKTIAHASAVTTASGAKTIWLLDGTYDASTEQGFAGSSAAACGASGSGVLLPINVDLRADHAGKARLQISGSHGLCARGGSLSGLVLERAEPGGKVLEAASGSLAVSGTRFANCGVPGVTGAVSSADAVDACTVVTSSASVTLETDTGAAWVTGKIGTFVAARDQAQVAVRGGSFSVAPSSHTQALFAAAEHAQLTLTNLNASSSTGGIAVQVQASSSLDIESGQVSGFDIACRANTADAHVTIDGMVVTTTQYALYVDTASNERGSFTLHDVHVSEANAAVLVQSGNLALSIAASELSDNKSAVLFDGHGEVSLQNATISGNETGLRLMASNGALALRLRGVKVLNNTQIGVLVGGSLDGSDDFGTLASPGNNVFMGNATAGTAGANLVLAGGYPVSVPAVGNTWDANVQQANSSGRYEAAGAGSKLEVSAGAGPNYRIVTGPTTLRLAENP